MAALIIHSFNIQPCAYCCACSLQVFLDLVVSHPNWLNTFLLEYNGPLGPSSPQAWAAEMLSWTLQAASKRCAHQLQAYVAACLRQHIILGPEAGNMGQVQQQQAAQQQAAERSLRQTLPPLGQSLIGVVEQLVLLIRGSVPRFSQGQMIYPSEPPTEVVKVLLSYAETSPWAAAHLLQVSQGALCLQMVHGTDFTCCAVCCLVRCCCCCCLHALSRCVSMHCCANCHIGLLVSGCCAESDAYCFAESDGCCCCCWCSLCRCSTWCLT